MATIKRAACFCGNRLGMGFQVPPRVSDGPPVFEGIGWAKAPLDWVMDWRGEFEKEIFHGKAWFRILRVDRGFPGFLYVVEAGNWRWPLWWVILRAWLFLCWFERNTCMTAVVWGLVKAEIGAEPRWGDLWPLPAIRALIKRRKGG